MSTSNRAATTKREVPTPADVVVVGAGFAGLYAQRGRVRSLNCTEAD